MTQDVPSFSDPASDMALFEDIDAEPSRPATPTPEGDQIFSSVEQRVISLLRERELVVSTLTPDEIEFAESGPRTFAPSYKFRRAELALLEEQLGWKTVEHPSYSGYLAPESGFVEIAIRLVLGPNTHLGARLSRLAISDAATCSHISGHSPQLPSMACEFDFINKTPVYNPKTHLFNHSSRECLELSNISPLGVIACSPLSRNARFTPTVKILFPEPLSVGDSLKRSEELLHSLLYELDVRNGLVLNVVRKPPSRSRAFTQSEPVPVVRFPEMELRHEVAALFNFASSARGNWPLAFLSYYQTLEYFVPAAMRRNSLAQLRKELHDPLFDKGKDDGLMRLIAIAEGSANSKEQEQFKTLIRDCVRQDRVASFLRDGDWGGHFTSGGPIKGVESLSLGNDQKGLLEQVANRVYKIRNRIVHAKDDPRYRDSRVLLPQSAEAEALGPDVQLIRLLASEVIIDSQGR